MNRLPEQPQGVDPRVHNSGDSLEQALLHLLPTDGSPTILVVDVDGNVAHIQPATKSIAVLSMADGLPFAVSDHPLIRFRNGDTLERVTYRLFDDSGEIRLIELSTQTTGTDRFFIAADVSDSTTATAKLKRAAETDEFTGAINYRGVVERLNKALHSARPLNDRVAVLAISLDGYRVLASSLASDVEPLVICEIAKRLKAVTREDEAVAYLGGDRFIVLIHRVANEPDAVAAAERMRRSISSPMKFGRREIRVSASIGVAFNGRRAEDASEILRNATVASHAARAQGENDWAVFDEAMRSRTLNNMRAEDMVDDALRLDSFAAEFQPMVNASNRAVVGFETLARIRANEGLNFPPASFIEAAERSGRITPLDRRILDLACDQAKRFDERRAGSLRVSINLSTHTALRPDLYSIVSDAIEEHRINPKLIALELREDAFLEAGTATKAAFDELQHDGVGIVLDGFGHGRIGAHHVAQYPVTMLKLHMNFVQGITTSSRDRSLTEAMVATAHALGMTVCASGVETAEQGAILADLGCNYLQGFSIGRPLTGHDAESLLFS
jgi:diguanylate cyclase (GGDEF)-like protein